MHKKSVLLELEIFWEVVLYSKKRPEPYNG